MSTAAKLWAGILVVAVAAYAAYTAVRIRHLSAGPRGGPQLIKLTPEPQPLTELRDIQLVERSGANFRWQQLDGEIWIANSFFTTCNRECSQLSHTIRALQLQLPGVRFVSITCDPDEDTPAKLREYAAAFAAPEDRWFFVTGKMTDLGRAGEILFGQPLVRYGHGGYVALVDSRGRRVGAYDALSRQGVMDLLEAVAGLQQNAAPRAPEPT